MKSFGITKVREMHTLGTMNVHVKFYLKKGGAAVAQRVEQVDQ